MARPERNNVDYFPFYCDEGNKMFYLEETYGNDGFATFMKLLRELAKADYHYLDVSKSTTLMFLSAKCKVTKETLEAIINDLVELEKFDKEFWNKSRIIWCQDFIDSIQDAYAKRSNDCIDKKSLQQLLISKGLLKPSKGLLKPSKSTSDYTVNPQSIVKYSKEEEIKEDNTKAFGELYYPFESLKFLEAFNLWVKYMSQTKKPIKGQIAAQAQLKKISELSKLNEELAIKIIMQSIENNWQGLFELKNNNNGTNQNNGRTVADRLRDTYSEKIRKQNQNS